MTGLAELRAQLLADPDVRAEYDRLGPIFAVVREMVKARTAAGLTQAEIARLEAARHMPTFDLLTRYAAAVGKRVEVRVV